VPGPQGIQGEPGGGLDVPFLKSLNWDPGEPVAANDAATLAQRLALSWTAAVDPDRFFRFERAAVQVFSAPDSPEFPVRSLTRAIKPSRNNVFISVDPGQVGFEELLRVGGALLIDIVCDYLVDANGLPFSSSLSPMLTGMDKALTPGGLLRLSLVVRPG
jgi:hypothetical protein